MQTKVFSFIILVAAFFACKTTQKISKATPNSILLISELSGCVEDSLGLYEFDGISFKSISKMGKVAGDSFQITLPAGAPRFYYVGNRDNRKRPVIVGTESIVSIAGQCKNIRNAKFVNSPLNKDYDALMHQLNLLNGNMSKAARDFQKNLRNEAKRDAAIKSMSKIDNQRVELLDSLKRSKPYIAKIAVLNTYLSFHNHNNSKHKHELDYFGHEYFSHVDFKDPDYNNIPYVFEAFKIWSKTLSMQKVPKQVVQSYIDSALVEIPSDSRTYKYALGGIVTSLQSKNHPLFATYGNQYIEKYKNDKGPAMNGLRSKIKMAGNFLTGAVAPDFTQNTPEGEPLSLSDLRGKVVLVDFWASWCGPCRRENPNVVRLYNQYKDHGFDVLGVSLDKTKGPWLKAIKKDGLPWHHVSDLRGWSNKAAKLYSVSSIPHTVLLDREGRIIARNLRGEQLHQQLKKIFGK